MNSKYNTMQIQELFVKKHVKVKFYFEDLPSDASLRRYSRVKTSEGSFIFMDASRDRHSLLSFMKIGKFLSSHNYSAPKIIAHDITNGFILLEDLGKDTYKSILVTGQTNYDEYELYKHAADILIDLHQLNTNIDLNSFTNQMLLDEVLLLFDYYLKILNGRELSTKLRDEYIIAWKKVFSCISYSKSCVVLKDYHVDNLIWLEDRVGLQKVGLLDFQDAALGSYAYDLVSLLEDARRDVPEKIVSKVSAHYLNSMSLVENKKFLSDYVIFGAQRSCKIIGIFSRKAIRDNDNRYLKHLPRVWSYVKGHIHNPLLEPVKHWFRKIDIPIMRGEC